MRVITMFYGHGYTRDQAITEAMKRARDDGWEPESCRVTQTKVVAVGQFDDYEATVDAYKHVDDPDAPF